MALEALVVSDATTIITLLNIDRIELLYHFCEHIIITTSVYDEAAVRKSAKESLDALTKTGKLSIEQPQDCSLVDELLTTLDMGESEAISLALEKSLPLIIDEKRGRVTAKRLNVKTIGLIGILLVLGRKNILSKSDIALIVEELDRVHFRLSDDLRQMLAE